MQLAVKPAAVYDAAGVIITASATFAKRPNERVPQVNADRTGSEAAG